MSKNITIVAGPCAVESEKQIMDVAYNIGKIRDVTKSYGIDFKLRGGAWKPRTSYLIQNGVVKKKVFEGVGEIGLKWLSHAADKYDLPIVSELMSEMDLRYFQKHLVPERDYLQIGARNSQNFALLFHAGTTNFGVILKNPQQGIDIKEAVGSMERFEHNKEIVYCTRGQKRFIPPNIKSSPEHNAYLTQLLQDSNQHPDTRNLNNIGAIDILRKNLSPSVKLCHDPSHTWGGKTHEMRKKIGEYAVKAVTDFGYDWVMVEVDNKSRYAKCDANQALVTSLNGVDWSQTYVETKPPENQMPLSLVDIVAEIMNHQEIENIQPCLEQLREIH